MGEAPLPRGTKIVPISGSLSHGLTENRQCFLLFHCCSKGHEGFGHFGKYTMDCRGTQEEPEGRPVHFWRNSVFGGRSKLEFGGAKPPEKIVFSVPRYNSSPRDKSPRCNSLLLRPPLWLRASQGMRNFPAPQTSLMASQGTDSGNLTEAEDGGRERPPPASIQLPAKHRESYQGQGEEGREQPRPPSVKLPVP